MIFEVQCSYCKHFNAQNHRKETCTAFSEGIPSAMLENRHDHRLPYSGDKGIHFEPTETALARFGAQGPYSVFESEEIVAPAERVA